MTNLLLCGIGIKLIHASEGSENAIEIKRGQTSYLPIDLTKHREAAKKGRSRYIYIYRERERARERNTLYS